MTFFHSIKSHDPRRHGHKAFTAGSQSFLPLFKILCENGSKSRPRSNSRGNYLEWFLYICWKSTGCEHSARIINLEFHSVALLYNCLDRVLSVLRSLLDQSEGLSCRNNLLQLCDCFSEIHQFWFGMMTEIDRRTVSLVDLGSHSVAHTSQRGRPKLVIADATSIKMD